MSRRVRSVLGLIVLLSLITAACTGGGSQADAAGESIVVGAIFDLSGDTAEVGTPYADGVRAYVEWRNANGGVGGRQIDLRFQDYAYRVPQAELLYSQYLSEGAVAFQGWGTADTEALRIKVTQDRIPFMSASYAETLTDAAQTPYNFVVALSYSDQMRIALQHIADVTDGHVEVAVFHHDSPFGTSPIEDGRAYIRQRGLDIGYQTYAMAASATDYVGELSRAEQQGADFIIIQNVSGTAATLARNVRDQGLDARILCLNWCGDELFIELAGDAVAEGALGVLPFAPPAGVTGDTTGLAAWLRQSGHHLEDLNLHFTQGWYTMHVMAEGIARVVASGVDVTGEAIKLALESLAPIETPVTTAISFSADCHKGMRSGQVYQVEGGAWTPIGDVLTP
ncbi:MAG: ABC transporter substrate-binding protein [Egibacteraceae bacterium]